MTEKSKLKLINRTAVVTTTSQDPVQIGDEIPLGHIRCIWRIKSHAVDGSSTTFNIYSGDTQNNTRNEIDIMLTKQGEVTVIGHDIESPLYTIRPDETGNETKNNRIYIKRGSNVDVTVFIDYYDIEGS